MLWSGIVSPKSPLSMEAPFDLRITMATLGEDVSERVTLVMTHEDFIAEEACSAFVCSLTPGKHENQTIDLVLDEGEPISFKVSGNGTIHLTGYFVIDDQGDDQGNDIIDSLGMFEDESDDESFEAPTLEESSEEISSDEEPKVKEISDAEVEQSILDKVRQKQASLKRKTPPTSQTPPKKKQKTQRDDPMDESPKKKEKQSPKQSPKEKQSPKQSPKDKPQTKRVQTLRGGTVAEILAPGKGSLTARKGQKVTVRYEGRLVKNQKKFDSGKFSFKLGKGDVIKGMDVGVEGMLLNEKRKITIPFNQAYGNNRTGDIPPKSDLEFTVTLLGMK